MAFSKVLQSSVFHGRSPPHLLRGNRAGIESVHRERDDVCSVPNLPIPDGQLKDGCLHFALCSCACVFAYLCICIPVCLCICAFLCLWFCVFVHLFTCVFVHLCALQSVVAVYCMFVQCVKTMIDLHYCCLNDARSDLNWERCRFLKRQCTDY